MQRNIKALNVVMSLGMSTILVFSGLFFPVSSVKASSNSAYTQDSGNYDKPASSHSEQSIVADMSVQMVGLLELIMVKPMVGNGSGQH